MKKLFFLLMIFALMVTGCGERAKEEKPLGVQMKQFDFSKVATISPDQVRKMAAHYNEIIRKDPKQCIQQINMDGEVLENLLNDTKTIQLIAAADLTSNSITAIIHLVRSGGSNYYDIRSLFNSDQPGMLSGPPICPPPDTCRIALSVETFKPTLLSHSAVKAMAKQYISVVQADPKMAVQQITMDANLLEALLYKTEGVQLIAAADLKTKEPTEIIQFTRGRVVSYYNITDIFTPATPGMHALSAICPPPDTCRREDYY